MVGVKDLRVHLVPSRRDPHLLYPYERRLGKRRGFFLADVAHLDPGLQRVCGDPGRWRDGCFRRRFGEELLFRFRFCFFCRLERGGFLFRLRSLRLLFPEPVPAFFGLGACRIFLSRGCSGRAGTFGRLLPSGGGRLPSASVVKYRLELLRRERQGCRNSDDKNDGLLQSQLQGRILAYFQRYSKGVTCCGEKVHLTIRPTLNKMCVPRYWGVVQLAERLALDQDVGGSSPPSPANFFRPVRSAVRTPASHVGNTGSSPVRATKVDSRGKIFIFVPFFKAPKGL